MMQISIEEQMQELRQLHDELMKADVTDKRRFIVFDAIMRINELRSQMDYFKKGYNDLRTSLIWTACKDKTPNIDKEVLAIELNGAMHVGVVFPFCDRFICLCDETEYNVAEYNVVAWIDKPVGFAD